MGIPVYFKTLVSQYQDSILIKKQIENVGSIFFDLNCLIHPCCHGETDETIMIQKIIQSIHDLVNYSNVQDLIYIAVDGIAPKGKMKTIRHASIDYGTQDTIGGESSKSRPFNLDEIFDDADTTMVSNKLPKLKYVFVYTFSFVDLCMCLP